MKSLVAPLATLALLAPAAAQAGTYVGVGLGTGASTDGGMSVMSSDGDHSARAVAGYRFGIVAVEADVGYFGLESSSYSWDATSIGAAAKLNVPITPLFDAFVRLGVEKTRLANPKYELMGSGWTGGLGVEYRLEKLSIWADYSKHTISYDKAEFDGAAAMLTVGVSFPISL